MAKKSGAPKAKKLLNKPSQQKVLLPDALFKTLTREEIEDNKLQPRDTEVQFIGRTDTVFEVPKGANIDNTIFEFCSEVNVIEFKSQNDPFAEEEFIENNVRTGIIFLQHLRKLKRGLKAQHDLAKTQAEVTQLLQETSPLINTLKEYQRFLNVYVLSRYPKDFLEEATKNDIIFTKDPKREWLWWSKVGYQKIAMVICRDLPIEKRFYKWLLFAPSDSNRWHEFVQRLENENELELLDLARQLRPEEFDMATLKRTAAEIWEEMRRVGALTPEVEAELAEQRARGVRGLLLDLDNRADFQIRMAIPDMSDEQLIGLTRDLSLDRLAAIAAKSKPEQLKRLADAAQEPKKRQLLQTLQQLLSE
jgi:hypothetical protein